MLCWEGWTRIYTERENWAEDTNEEIREMSAMVGECQQLRGRQRWRGKTSRTGSVWCEGR